MFGNIAILILNFKPKDSQSCATNTDKGNHKDSQCTNFTLQRPACGARGHCTYKEDSLGKHLKVLMTIISVLKMCRKEECDMFIVSAYNSKLQFSQRNPRVE